MKINWKLRFQNKATLTAIILAVIALIYQILGLFGIVPSISENKIIEIAGMIIDLGVLLGIVIDPTTAGITDSNRAMTYDKPNNDKGEI